MMTGTTECVVCVVRCVVCGMTATVDDVGFKEKSAGSAQAKRSRALALDWEIGIGAISGMAKIGCVLATMMI